jgi:hypothetical protein
VVASSQYLGDEYTTKKLLEIFGDIDEFENIQKQKQDAEIAMFNAQSNTAVQKTENGDDK